ncbi:hypothetical protein ONA70_34165 [Micromonospora yasonensis]|uniref:hypothetical protein n=1 Tax=Micromonospora yasonensis TaxID=1128667 RepID=UPI00222E4D0C|nr:hypothetical protein [Micromonospora yasonensis]MCW3845125.1 hypothetical protein [Micromonospora yasonensis]
MVRIAFRRGPRPPAADLDPALDDLELRAARDKAVSGDWTAARDIVRAAGVDWERRGRRIDVLSRAAARDGAWLDAWLTAAPDDPTVVTLQAETLYSRAARARGSAPAVETSRKRLRQFAELSAQAEVVSRRAVQLAPRDPVPWAVLLDSMLAAGPQRWADFGAALAEGRLRDRHNFSINLAAVSFYCAKWGGSHEKMFTAARECADAAPPGAGVTLLPVFAHLEYAMQRYLMGGQPWLYGIIMSRRYFRRPEVSQEIDACAGKWRAAGPPRHAQAMVCRNWLALAYSLGGRRAEARAVFEEIGPYAASPVWAYFHSSERGGFLENRRWANRRS